MGASGSNKTKLRKVTVMLPEQLIKQATSASGVGLTPTIRQGLEKIVTANVYQELRNMRGKVHLDPEFFKALRNDFE